MDVKGCLVFEEMIKFIDLECDCFVQEIVVKGKVLNKVLLDFKLVIFGDIEVFIILLVEQYQVKVGGKKGNVFLVSFDGCYKVIWVMVDNIVFDECLQVVKVLIDECFYEWMEGVCVEVIMLINDVFCVD